MRRIRISHLYYKIQGQAGDLREDDTEASIVDMDVSTKNQPNGDGGPEALYCGVN